MKVIILVSRLIRMIQELAYQSYIDKTLGKGIAHRVGERLFLIGNEHIEWGMNITIADCCTITAWDEFAGEHHTPSIKFGKNCNIGCYNNITAINKIEIGDNLLTGRWVTITDHAHGNGLPEEASIAPIDRKLFSKGPIIIGSNVWIGDKATILPNVTIGDNVTIGANSVVTRSLPNNCIAAGNPAKVIKIKDDIQ